MKDLLHFSKYAFLSEFAILLSPMFTRLSVGLFLLRLATTGSWFQRSTYAIIGLIMVTNLTLVILNSVRCRPFEKLWRPTTRGTCWSKETTLGITLCNGGRVSMLTGVSPSSKLIFVESSQQFPIWLWRFCPPFSCGMYR